MGYLAGTIELYLTLKIEGPIRVTAYVDASFASHSSDMKSHTGVYITLGKGAIYCRSSKQKLVSKSSTEAELVGISDGLPQIIWFKHFLKLRDIPLCLHTYGRIICPLYALRKPVDLAARDPDTLKFDFSGFVTS